MFEAVCFEGWGWFGLGLKVWVSRIGLLKLKIHAGQGMESKGSACAQKDGLQVVEEANNAVSILRA